jgi:hypothetical protein
LRGQTCLLTFGLSQTLSAHTTANDHDVRKHLLL